jgi:putative spermidine/putrescine transport system ATP-binding protein
MHVGHGGSRLHHRSGRQGAVQLRKQIWALQGRLHITTVSVTHDQEALSVADRISFMCRGRIERIDSPAVFHSDAATQLVAEFVGTMDRVPGHLERSRPSVNNHGPRPLP